MTKYSFMDDYSEGCHPQILKAMAETNRVQQIAYGDDTYCQEAKKLIRGLLGQEEAPVFFVAGGTLANLIAISKSLRPHEAIISAASGHIELRETGAIEAVGHKILTQATKDGKLTPELIQATLNANSHAPHMVKPRMVYVSNATEFGTLYSKAELTAIAAFCRHQGLLLFLDGARLGAALSAPKNDLTMRDLYKLTDVFWIGGTKAGALIGEAIVIPNQEIAEDFAYVVKQRGALLAKGRLLGIQFRELFKDNLYFAATARANSLAARISEAVLSNGYKLAAETETNQIFPILPNALIDRLQEKFSFYNWAKVDDQHSTLRLVTSWATDETQVDAFIKALEA